ncbi:CBASS cGAMP-activated phospholipase [Marinobacteraceae bacterium S3BR75-40.1]
MKTVLSLDGGGIRGLIPALVLAELEKRVGRGIAQMFDLIAGTSTGGILALGLNVDDGNQRPRYSATDLARLYRDRGRDIFSRSLWKGVSSVGGLADEKYSADGLEKLLEEYFGNEPLGSCLTRTLVTAYDIEHRAPYFFKSWRETWRSVEMRHVARATSAAPTYFEPALVPVGSSQIALIDGGVFINNPAMSAYAEAVRLFDNPEDIVVVSIGTGELTRPIDYREARDWGMTAWLQPLLGSVFDGVSDAANYQLDKLLGNRFIRFQVNLDIASDDMDNATRGNIENLATEARRLIKSQRHDLDRLTALFTATEALTAVPS